MRAILVGLGITAVWYGLVLYVNPFPRVEEVFCGNFTSVLVSIAGFVGLSLAVKTIIAQRGLKEDVKRTIGMIDEASGAFDNLESYKHFVCEKVKKDFGFLKVFPNLCVILGLLGTIWGIAQGMDSMAIVWAGAGDIVTIKSEVSQFIRSLSKAFDSSILGLSFGIITGVVITVGQRWSEMAVMGYFSEKAKNLLIELDKTSGGQPLKEKNGSPGVGDRS